MNKILPLRAIIIMIAVFMSGSCSDLMDDIGFSAKAGRSLLKEFDFDGRHYEFHYNPDGTVRMIHVHHDAMEYFYHTEYSNGRIVKAGLVDGEEIISTNKDFIVDNRGNIIQYTYSVAVPDLPDGFNTVYKVAYDKKGRMISVEGTSVASMEYDNRNNVVKWTPRAEINNLAFTYTYDNAKNPLATVKDLFVLLTEETVYLEYISSQHNSLSKTTPPGMYEVPGTILCGNTYDRQKRITGKKGIRNGEKVMEMEFCYY